MKHIHINTLNLLKPWRTYRANKHLVKKPSISCKFFKSSFEELKRHHYTWFWWDNDYTDTKLLVLIDDVFTKTKFGMIELEQVPFILIRLFKWNFLLKLEAPKNQDNYEYWENMNLYLFDDE